MLKGVVGGVIVAIGVFGASDAQATNLGAQGGFGLGGILDFLDDLHDQDKPHGLPQLPKLDNPVLNPHDLFDVDLGGHGLPLIHGGINLPDILGGLLGGHHGPIFPYPGHGSGGGGGGGSAVPEPASLSLMTAALLGGYCRKRKTKAA